MSILKLPKVVWIPGLVAVALTVGGGLWTSRLNPPLPLLRGATPQIVRVEPDRLKTGTVRKVFVYRFETDYFKQIQAALALFSKSPDWKLDGGGEEPDWIEFQGGDESIEFVNDVPTDFNAKSNGVMWSPAGRTGKVMTVFYTRPASGMERVIHEISSLVTGKSSKP